mgnify:CR=1 FL=1
MISVTALAEIVQAGFDDRAISYLPAAHIADRVSSHAANMMRGIQITTVPDPREIAAALPDVHPTFFFGVPRVWRGPSITWTAAYGGTRTSTERPGVGQQS